MFMGLPISLVEPRVPAVTRPSELTTPISSSLKLYLEKIVHILNVDLCM